MPSKALVLDANILSRAVLGKHVRGILESHADAISFFIPATAYEEAEEHLAALVIKRGGEPEKALRLLRALAALGTVMTRETYADFEIQLGRSAIRTHGRAIREILLSYPSTYQLLPEHPCGLGQRGNSIDWFNDPSWLPAQYTPFIRNAAETRRQIGHHSSYRRSASSDMA